MQPDLFVYRRAKRVRVVHLGTAPRVRCRQSIPDAVETDVAPAPHAFSPPVRHAGRAFAELGVRPADGPATPPPAKAPDVAPARTPVDVPETLRFTALIANISRAEVRERATLHLLGEWPPRIAPCEPAVVDPG